MLRASCRHAVAAALLFALSACAPQPTWIRGDVSESDFRRDLARCDYEAAAATANYGTGASTGLGMNLGIGQSAARNHLMNECMRAQGYAQRTGGGSPYGGGAMTTELTSAPPPPPAPVPVAVRPRPAPVATTPPASGLRGESKYLLRAEKVAKANGCTDALVTLTAREAGEESFVAGCVTGPSITLRCDVEACRVAR